VSAAEQALHRLGASTAEAVLGVLRNFSPEVAPGAIRVVPPGTSPFAELTAPAVAAGEAMNQMMSAAAVATGTVLGEEVEIAPPDVRLVEDRETAAQAWEHPGHATVVSFTFCGAPCLLVQLVPNAFIVRMTRALDELTHQEYDDAPLGDALREVRVRVWAELGRTRMPSGRVVALPGGQVVELDREVEAPIDLYADGMRFASGRLLVTEDGGLAVRIEHVLGAPADGPDEVQTPTTPTDPPREVAV
jgi:flagellar motor switch protein FliN/FliY